MTENNTTMADGTILHCAGVWGTQCGEPQNRWKSSLRTTWTDSSGDFSLSLRWRHLSGVQFEQNDNGAGGQIVVPATPAFTNIPTLQFNDFDYFDLSGTWSVAQSVDLRAGVRNLFDRDPPVTDNNTAPASSINNNTFPNTYDALGRVIFVGATVKL